MADQSENARPDNIFVRSNRILSYINYLIALALVAVALAGYWYAYRPQAQTSGDVPAGVGAEVSIARDALGVPHISARSLDDLFFAQGYAHAQDRLFQLDVTRRQASGELAEIFGPASLPADLDARRLHMRRIAEGHTASLDPESRAAFTAYARGINHFIETHVGRLPLEFTALGYDPTPWTVTDSVLVSLNIARSLNEGGQYELAKQAMLASGGDRDLVEYLFPTRTGAEPQVGSNAWAVSGRLTQSGKPILASDPHLPLSLPGVWYENDLRAPGFHVAGASIPGIPAVVVGHNDSIAWGIANLQFDVQDLYLERVDLSQGVSLYNGAAEPILRGTESVRVKGGAIATVSTAATRRGPLLNESARTAAGIPFQIALRWTAAEPGGLSFALIKLNRATNWDQFRQALRNWTSPAQNFVYADAAGNIGYQAAGILPKRMGHNGDLPADGTTSQFDWQGAIPFDDLPSVYNPPSGRVITANQNPFPANYAYRVNGNFAPPDRARQIEARLQALTTPAKPKLTVDDMLSIQTDRYSAFHHFLASQIVAAARDRTGSNAELTEAVRLLAAWDGQMSAGSAPGMITALVWQSLRPAIVERAAPGRSTSYDFPMATGAAERLLRERPTRFFDNYDALLLRATLNALALGVKEQGSTLANWRLGQHQVITLSSPVLGQVRILNSALAGWTRISLQEMGGASTTVNQRTQRGNQTIAPSMRMVIDLGNLDASVFNLATGQSGQVFSSHYTDQWNAYKGGTSFPFPYNKVDAPSVLRLIPR